MHVYDFFRDSEKTSEEPEITERIAMAGDRTKAIIQAALDSADPSPRCTATIDTVVSIMGSEAGNLAFKVLVVGGVLSGRWRCGSSPAGPEIVAIPAIVPSQGRFADVMGQIPIHLMTGKVAIAGAAAYGLKRVRYRKSGHPRAGRSAPGPQA